MTNRFQELRDKEVIYVCEGARLGYVSDLVVDICSGRVTAIVVPGPCRFLGLFGREDDYVILGDNCIKKEYGITDDDIIGVMTSFVRKGREYSVTDWRYRLYSRIWCAAHPLWILFYRARRFVSNRLK